MREKIIDFLTEAGILSKYTLSGALGALAYSLHKRRGFWEGVRDIISGSITAIYIAPFVADHTGMDLAFLGFLVGILGINVVSVIADVYLKYKDKVVQALKEALKVLNK